MVGGDDCIVEIRLRSSQVLADRECINVVDVNAKTVTIAAQYQAAASYCQHISVSVTFRIRRGSEPGGKSSQSATTCSPILLSSLNNASTWRARKKPSKTLKSFQNIVSQKTKRPNKT